MYIMKKIILFLTFMLFLGKGFSQVAVVYDSDDPTSSCAAAIVDQKYALSYVLDVADADSTAQQTWLATVSDSLTYSYIFADTSTTYSEDDVLTAVYTGLNGMLYTASSANLEYYVGSSSLTKCEQAWDSIYSGITKPLIVYYLSESAFCEDQFDASAGTDTTIQKTNATGWSDDGFNSTYTAYVTAGPNIGEARVIEDTYAAASGDADTLEVSPAFTADITSSSDLTILKTSLYNKHGFYDMYAYYGVLVNIADIETYDDQWKSLLNYNNSLINMPTGSGRAVLQDRTYLDELIDDGKKIFEYLIETN